MKILHNRVLVKPIKEEEVRASGIILPTREKKYPIGEILQIGVKVKELKVGQKIMYYKHHNGVPITVEGDDCLLLSESGDIISVI